MGDAHVGSEHILLGVVVEGTSPASQVLVAHGASDRRCGRRCGDARPGPPLAGRRDRPAPGPVARGRRPGLVEQDPRRRARRGRTTRPWPPGWSPTSPRSGRRDGPRTCWPRPSGCWPRERRRPRLGAPSALYGALAVVTLPRPERWSEADAWLELALTDAATRVPGLHLRGRLRVAQGRRAEAVQVFDLALAELAPGDPQAPRLWVSRLSATTDRADTERLLDGVAAQLDASASERDRVAVLVVAASAIVQDLVAERFPAAEAMAEEAVALAPDDELGAGRALVGAGGHRQGPRGARRTAAGGGTGPAPAPATSSAPATPAWRGRWSTPATRRPLAATPRRPSASVPTARS